jgi:glycosyltransferase involved in cell wall biosynthesis
MNLSPLVSVIIPTRNEEKFIEPCLNSIINSDYPKESLEIIVIDGMSDDNTRNRVKEFAKDYPIVYLLDNANKTVPYAMNLGIHSASGEYIVRLDAHAIYPKRYISKLIYYSQMLNADNVGGVWNTIPGSNSSISVAISLALTSRFGVGNAEYRVNRTNLEYLLVDTVPFGCFKKKIFEEIGCYDVELTRNQDNELNERILKNGGKIYLIPSLKIDYYARENFKKLWLMFYQYGYFGPLVDFKLGRPTRLRKYIPSIFILSLILPLVVSVAFSKIAIISFLSLSLYFLVNSLFSVTVSKKKNIKLIPFVFWAFLVSHMSYGFGYIFGFFNFIILRKINSNAEISR